VVGLGVLYRRANFVGIGTAVMKYVHAGVVQV